MLIYSVPYTKGPEWKQQSSASCVSKENVDTSWATHIRPQEA